nr:hypothetical protein [Kibdelosporangium sp. MJ126-NF4]CTQ99203.1 hypothetical protein [Kibdelosporangium sp. MJ126-NF4]
MPNTNQHDTDQHTPAPSDPEPLTDDIDDQLARLVADQAPRLFAVAFEFDGPEEPVIAAWGMDFDDSAYMVTANGNTHFSLATADNALNYVRTGPSATSHLIWTTAKPAPPDTDN